MLSQGALRVANEEGRAGGVASAPSNLLYELLSFASRARGVARQRSAVIVRVAPLEFRLQFFQPDATEEAGGEEFCEWLIAQHAGVCRECGAAPADPRRLQHFCTLLAPPAGFAMFLRRAHEMALADDLYERAPAHVFSQEALVRLLRVLAPFGVESSQGGAAMLKRAMKEKHDYTLQFLMNFFRQVTTHVARFVSLATAEAVEQECIRFILDASPAFLDALFALSAHL